jgi:hypothetical protein
MPAKPICKTRGFKCAASPYPFKPRFWGWHLPTDKANWANARAKMQSALASEPNPQARVRLYGMVFSAYIPHYYLALASFKLGDCNAAKAALSNSAHLAIMREAKGVEAELAQSKLILAQCGAKPNVPAPPVPNLPPIETIPTTPNTSQADAARAKAEALAQAQAQAALEIRQREEKIAADALAAQQAREAATTAPSPVVKPPVPAALTIIASSYFSGNLPEAARANVASLSGKALAHALLLRAAAKHGLYQQQGGKNAQQLIDLKADLSSAKRADASAKPTTRYFNRDFISLYAAP